MQNKVDAYISLRIRDFRYFIITRLFLTLALQMQSVLVGWQIYEKSRDPLSLGLSGLAEIIPAISVALFSGQLADKMDRKIMALVSQCLALLCASLLFFVSSIQNHFSNENFVLMIYGVVFIGGLARGFLTPSFNAFMAELVPKNLYANSSAWSSSTWQIAAVLGPALGGLIYGFLGPLYAYGSCALLLLIAVFFFSRIPSRHRNRSIEAESSRDMGLFSGVKFVFGNQVILGALSLDLFAVLFGGAVALLPIFSAEILFTGPEGLGILRAAPSIGASVMAVYLAYFPPMLQSGKILLGCVAGFGLSIILFGLSVNFYLSFVLLALSGMFDEISVVLRSTILQVLTPSDMRGRVSAVNSIFIGSSNEIGAFESGLAAKLLGTVPSVIFGGIMTMGIVGFTAIRAPKLRNFSLQEVMNQSLKDEKSVE